jgi:glycosyltransferase involved in cell wall biosynthesis
VRILLVSDHYPPFIGGAHRQTQLLAQNLTARGHAVEVATSWHGGMPPREQDGDGIVVHRVRQLRTVVRRLVRDTEQRQATPFPDPVTVRDLRRVIAAARPDVIHAYGWITFSLAVALIGKRIPLLVSARDYGYFCATRTFMHRDRPCTGPGPLKCLSCAGSWYGAPKGWVAAIGVAACRPLLVRKATGVHSVSSYMRGVTRAHTLRGRNGVAEVTIPSFQSRSSTDISANELAPYLDALPREPFILFVGPLRRIKGLEVLFEAYRRLDSPPPLVLMGMAGHDPPRGIPDGAVVLTDVPHPAVLAAWDRALFGVMPSLWPEPYGAVVAEAMSRGRPVIGTLVGGHADMLDESCGLLVPQGDVAALADAMQTLIDDPARREAMGRAARARAQSFTAAAVVPRFERAYGDLLTHDASA